jgi:hypothetical protein
MRAPAVAVEPTTLFVVILGVRIAIRLDDPSAVGRVTACLPRPWCLCSPAKIDRVYRLARTKHASWTLFGDDTRLDQALNLASLCDRFRADLERFVAIHARTHAVVTTIVVGWEGRAIVLPGASVNGRRSLVDRLIELGAPSYSDGYARIDVRGRVTPFPRPLSTKPSLREHDLGALENSGAVGDGPLPIGWIVVGDPQSQDPEDSQELTRTHAIRALLSSAPAARTQPEFLLQILRTAARDAMILPAPRADTTAAAYQLLADCVTTGESLIPHR